MLRELVKGNLEVIGNIGRVKRLMGNNEVDDLGEVEDFVVWEEIKGGIKRRIEEEGLEKERGKFVLEWCGCLVEMIDRVGVILEELVIVGGMKNGLNL